MIYVDYRAGSHELVDPLKLAGLPVEETTLPAGDVAFTGRGERGKELLIGVEYKKLSELVTSLRDERLQGHQLPEMAKAGYDHTWLLIEGELLYDNVGKLQRRVKWPKKGFKPLPGGMTVGELFKRINVLHLCGGLNPWWTQDRRQTVTWLEILYRTWTDKALDEHKSHLGVYHAPTLVPVSPERRTLMTLPRVGFRVSGAVLARFGSIQRAFLAPPEDWAAIETLDDKGKTRRLGMKVAIKVHNYIHNKGD